MLEYLLAARNPPDSRRAVHRKEDSPGIHRSQHPCDLGRAVALSGAAGEPRGRADGGLHHPTRDRGSGARGFGAKLAFTDFREMVVSKEIDAVAVADACCD